MAVDLAAVASEMARAIELTMDPTVPQQQRMQAYTAYEEFKENSPLCAQCGFYLAQNERMSHFVRHFGLQLIEHCVKYRWNVLVQEEKLYIKENAMKMLYTGISSEQTHMKDALSRVVVEMAKREWPQQWPDLLKELSDACKLGEDQTELVLLVFLRLVEDVVLLKTLESNQRRKDIYQALMSSMPDIFMFLLTIAEEHCSSYQVKTESGLANEAAPHLRVVHAALKTLTGFVEWVTMSHIMVADGRLLQILCLLLTRKEFQVPAAECLAQIANRRGRNADRKPLLILFSEDALQCMTRGLECGGEETSFVKLLAQVLAGLGAQLARLWDKESGPTVRPARFELFLSLALRLIRMPGFALAHLVNPVWVAFLKNEAIATDPCFLEALPGWLEAVAAKVVRPEFSSALRRDYATEEEFSTHFSRLRHDLLKAVRSAAGVAPLVTFSYVEKWLLACLCRPATPEPEWEAMAQVLDSSLAGPCQALLEPGLRLMVACLNYNSPFPTVQSTLLSCISSLFVFLSLDRTSQLLPQVLEKIFAALVFVSPGRSPEDPSPDERSLHSHAANLMVKLSRKYPEVLLPIFPQIHGSVASLVGLAWRDHVSLQEALLLLCNHLGDYERQTRFIEEMVAHWQKRWLDLGQKAFKSPLDLMSYLGLDRPAREGDAAFASDRSNLHCCCTLLLIVAKHSTWPEDHDRAARGGFCTGDPPVFRNPSAPHLVPLLPTLLALGKCLNGLWTPPALARLDESYRPAYEVVATNEGSGPATVPKASKSPVERMRVLLSTVHESCYVALGCVALNLGRDFFGLGGLALSLVDSVLYELDSMPDHRLRALVAKFLKQLVTACPHQSYENVLLPVLGHLCPFMVRRLEDKWRYVTTTQQQEDEEVEGSEQREVTEDMVTRMLTRDYLDVLKLALVGGNQPVPSTITNHMEQDEGAPRFNSLTQTKVSELGVLILRHEATCQSVVLCVLRALSWSDTVASMTATVLVAPVVRRLVADGRVDPTLAAYVMTSVLQGLQTHGQHETNSCSLYTLGGLAYEVLRPEFPSIVEVMMQIPGCGETDLKKLDDRVLASKQAPPGSKMEKAKRDAFVRVAKGLVGRSVGQLFRKEVAMAELPRLNPTLLRPKQPPLDETLGDGETLCPVFSPSRS